MTVFKATMKIFKRNWVMLAIYFGIFTFISFATSKKDGGAEMQELSSVEDIRVTVINEDDSAYADSLVSYIDKTYKLTDILETEEGISDALFYRITQYIVVIPKGFGEAIENNGDVKLKKYEVAGSTVSMFMDNAINDYVSKLKLYGEDVPDKKEISIGFVNENKEESGTVSLYNFAAYALMSIVILGVGKMLLIFGKTDIKRRNQVSPVTGVKRSLCQLVACMIFAILVWALITIVSVSIINPDNMTGTEVAMTANMFVFTMVCLSMAFCIGAVIKSANGVDIVANVCSLGFSFIGGVMIPVDMLTDNVKVIGSFTPTYWYTKTNSILSLGNGISSENISEVAKHLGVQLLFAIVFITVGLASIRKASLRGEK